MREQWELLENNNCENLEIVELHSWIHRKKRNGDKH
jgi:hypothetical protein